MTTRGRTWQLRLRSITRDRAGSLGDRGDSRGFRRKWLIPSILALASCGEHAAMPDAQQDASPDAALVYEPSLPLVLSADREGINEDLALLRARDGSIYVAWSWRGDIVLSRTTDGVYWSDPTPLTSGPGIDLGPTLYQDPSGVIHAAWARSGKIAYARTTMVDSIAVWSPEISVTSAQDGDDSAPSLTANAAGELVLAFARTTCPQPDTCHGIMASSSTDGGETWGSPVQVVAASGTIEHHLPAIANVGTELVIAWNPYDKSASAPWESTLSGAHVSTIRSASGGSWSAMTQLTLRSDTGVTVSPTLYADHAGTWHAAYLFAFASTRVVRAVPLATPTAMAVQLPLYGYSPRVVATPTPGVFLGAWVDGPDGSRDIFVRVFRND